MKRSKFSEEPTVVPFGKLKVAPRWEMSVGGSTLVSNPSTLEKGIRASGRERTPSTAAGGGSE